MRTNGNLFRLVIGRVRTTRHESTDNRLADTEQMRFQPDVEEAYRNAIGDNRVSTIRPAVRFRVRAGRREGEDRQRSRADDLRPLHKATRDI